MEYAEKNNIIFSRIVHACGSIGTQVGLLLGQFISGYDTKIIGIAVSQKKHVQYERISQLLDSSANIMGIKIDKSKIHVDDNFIGPGYALPSDKGIAAMKYFAETEGILLDHVYTAKAAAGLISHAENLKSDGDCTLFIHTGGNSGVYY